MIQKDENKLMRDLFTNSLPLTSWNSSISLGDSSHLSFFERQQSGSRSHSLLFSKVVCACGAHVDLFCFCPT